MEKEQNFKRSCEKWVRDRAKARYKKGDCCFICGATEDLDFHHFYSVRNLLDKWLAENGITIECDEDIIRVRDEFISVHEKEMYEDTVTLCGTHHNRLHGLYGAKPGLATAVKQINWVAKQREKHNAN